MLSARAAQILSHHFAVRSLVPCASKVMARSAVPLTSPKTAFITAIPLQIYQATCSSYLKKSSHRRLRLRLYARASPPEVHAALQTALSKLDSFSGSKAEARALTISLLDTVTSQIPGFTKDPNPPGESITPLYNALSSKQYLKAFASARPPKSAPPAQKAISVERLISRAGLPLSALAPRRSTVLLWQLAGVAAVIITVQILRLAGLQQYAKPMLFSLGALFLVDQIGLRGLLFESAYRKLFPQYEEKVLTHEAGHFLAAYLHGMPVRGYILSAGEAFISGIPGQAGTLFSDDELCAQIRDGRLTNGAIDRFSIVAMAGIAAEAIHYGEAEGGATDVSDLISLLTGLQPAWTGINVKRQARWAVLEAILLLRRQEEAFKALRDAMRERRSLGECVLRIEDTFVEEKVGEVEEEGLAVTAAREVEKELEEREREIVSELEKIRERVELLDGKSKEKR